MDSTGKGPQEFGGEAMRKQVQFLDSLLCSLADCAYIIDTKGCFTYANQALLDLWQMTTEQALGKNFFELPYPHELAARLQRQLQTVVETGQALKEEMHYTNPMGATGYYEYVFVPVLDKEGQVECVAGSAHDVTARRKERAATASLLKALEVENARLSILFMQAPAFMAVMSGSQHVFERVNPPYDQLVGKRYLIGKSVREAFPEWEGQGFFELLDQVYQTGIAFIGKQTPVVFQSALDTPPERRSLDFVYQPIVETDGSVSGILVHGVDLTERQPATQAVEAVNRRLQRALAETHHRVKNNLQALSALIEITPSDGAGRIAASALERLKGHISALASLHDLLTQESKTGEGDNAPSLRELLDKLAPMLQLAAGDRPVQVEAQEMRLPTKQASSLALLVNELIANAIKHGEGEIRVTVRQEKDAGGQERIRLSVFDDGPGFAADFNPLQDANTGLELIRSLGEWDLQGELFFLNRPEGGACVGVVFPATPLTL